MTQQKGTLYVIAAPSGAGKTSLVKALLDITSHVSVSISHTTRDKRPGEQDGVNYHFVSKKQFEELLKENDFLEHATVFNHYYGTSKNWVQQTLDSGQDVVLEIDWQGHQQIKKIMPECISIFILPPSEKALEERLINRKQDSKEVIKTRLADSHEAISHAKEFDYIVVNDDFDLALSQLKCIIIAARLTGSKQLIKQATLLQQFSAT